jgi:hypothetical protein
MILAWRDEGAWASVKRVVGGGKVNSDMHDGILHRA